VAVVAARITGWIEDLRVAQSGEPVKKGQVLATQYSPELRSAQQVLVNAVRWTQGQTTVAPVQTISGAEADARRRLELLGVARQDVDEIARSGVPIDAVPIRSPVNGYVARKSALVGLYVQPGTELFQIADLSAVWIVADVYEPDLERVKVGCKARFLLPSSPGEEVSGTVRFMYPAVNPESHTVQARIALRNAGLRLRPGMYGDVVFELPPVEALTVPAEALIDTGEVQYVFVAREGGRFEPRKVRAGARAGSSVQILQGLAEGERVVTTASFLLDSESRLRAAVEGFGPRPSDDDADDAPRR
jgi:Cu(I)/Ag(I) efflux system membrane fusion protein